MPTLAIPTLLATCALIWVGWRVGERVRATAAVSLALVASLPALSYALYYAHWYDDVAWFHSLRAIPGSELLGAAVGLSAGLMSRVLSRWSLGTWLPVARAFLLAGALCVLVVPYLKPMMRPLSVQSLRDRWRDSVCIQSSGATCGACSGATLLRRFGIQATEPELAAAAYSTASGTENWYLVRALRARGLDVRAEWRDLSKEGLPIPSIAGVQLGSHSGIGHFITLLEDRGDAILVGEPLEGPKVILKTALANHPLYRFTGFFLTPSR